MKESLQPVWRPAPPLLSTYKVAPVVETGWVVALTLADWAEGLPAAS
ncbi:MAG: hypothetical protein HYT46_01805 [Candidatus Vogelbacteria bacterium]|nr:hypothetical protein [Candidatus Vogelbacteria bacterium]